MVVLAAGCGGGAKTCVTYVDCEQGQTCSRDSATCIEAANLPLGEACSADAQCVSGLCKDSAYCSESCAADDTCSTDTVCLCDDTACDGDSHCVPKCNTPNGNTMECARFNATETNTCGMVGGSTDYGACSTQ